MTQHSITRTAITVAASWMLCASLAQAASLQVVQTGKSKGFKSNSAGHTQQVQQGCEDDVTQTSYMGPCKHHDSTSTTIVVEGCHNNVTQTSTPEPCPEG